MATFPFDPTNIEQLRQHLLFTQRGLQQLNLLETDDIAAERERELTSPSTNATFETLTIDDLSPQTPQVTPIKSLPQGNALASSTPKAHRMNHHATSQGGHSRNSSHNQGGHSRNLNQGGSSGSQGGHSSGQNQGSRSRSHAAQSRPESRSKNGFSKPDGYLSSGSSSSERDGQTLLTSRIRGELAGDFLEEENEELRLKLQEMRKSNADLTSHNHDLLNQLETMGHQHRQYKLKLNQMSGSHTELQSEMSQLKVQLAEKQQQTQSLSQTLRDHEEQAVDSQAKIQDLECHLEESMKTINALKQQTKMLTSELISIKTLKDKAEQECNRALQAAETMQKSVEEYHKKTQGKVKQFESTESVLRKKLNDSDEQKMVLQQTVHDMEAEITDLREEIRRFEEENSSERDARMSAEEQNIELRTQIAKLTARLGKLEKGSNVNSDLLQQNAELDHQVEQLRRELRQSRSEVNETRRRLEETLASTDNLDPSDSGLGLSEPSQVHDLRECLRERDQEIAVLRARLGNRESLEQDSLDSSLRQTQAIKDRLERRISELEMLVSSLEEERGRHTSKILMLEEQKTDLEMSVSSLTAKLEHRTLQADNLNQELREVNNSTVTLERQLRKMETESSSLQQQLEDRKQESAQSQVLTSQLTRDLQERNNELQAAQTQLQQTHILLEKSEAENKELQQVHGDRWKTMENELKSLRAGLSEKESELSGTLQDMDRVTQDLNAKDMAISDMTQELRASRAESERTLANVEQRATEATSQVHELQAALTVCREELQVYVEQVEGNKNKHEQVITQKNKKIKDLEFELTEIRQQDTDKDLAQSELQLELIGKNEALHHSIERQKQLEAENLALHNKVGLLEQRVGQTEKQLESERQVREQDLHNLRDRLQTVTNELADKEQEIAALHDDTDHAIEKLQSELSEAHEKVSQLEAVVEDRHDDYFELERKTDKLEADLKETRKSLREYRDQVDTLEENLQTTEEELREKKDKLSELNRQLQAKEQVLKNSKMELDTSRGQQQSLKEEMQKHKEALTERNRQLATLNNKFSACQESLEHKQQEMDQLCTTLQQQQWQLQQRAGQVNQLDVVLNEHKSEMAQRLSSLEGALKKTQLEAQQRSKQVGVLDEQVELLKTELREKELQLEESTKTCSRQQLQLHSSADNISSLQHKVQDLQNQLLQLTEENSELHKELDASRVEEQRLQKEVTEAKCEMSLSQRQLERLNSQLQEAIQQCQSQKEGSSVLAESLELLSTQKAKLESQNEAGKRQLQRELETIQNNYQQQLDKLRRETATIADKLEGDQSKLKEKLQGSQERAEQLQKELEATRMELERKTQDLVASKNAMYSTNSSLMVKEAEVARLEARLTDLQNNITATTYPVTSVSRTPYQNLSVFQTSQAGPIASQPSMYSSQSLPFQSQILKPESHMPISSYPLSFPSSQTNPESQLAGFQTQQLSSQMPQEIGSTVLATLAEANRLGSHNVSEESSSGQESDNKRGRVRFDEASFLQTNTGPEQGLVSRIPNLEVQDFHRSYPPVGSGRSRSEGIENQVNMSQYMSLSISDISRADTADTYHVISEADPDSLQSMLQEVQTMDQSKQSTIGARGVTARAGAAGRLFGTGAWPTNRTTNTSLSRSQTNQTKPLTTSRNVPSVRTGVKKVTKLEELRKNKGPLHSSPQNRVATKSVFQSKTSQVLKPDGAAKLRQFGQINYNNNNNIPEKDHPHAQIPTKQKKPKVQSSPDLPAQSPNISTAIAHYTEEGEDIATELFPEHQGGDQKPQPGSDGSGQFLGDFQNDLASRRKVLESMQKELQSHLEAVEEHLGES